MTTEDNVLVALIADSIDPDSPERRAAACILLRVLMGEREVEPPLATRMEFIEAEAGPAVAREIGMLIRKHKLR